MQHTLGTTQKTGDVMKLWRARTKIETKEFMDEFAKHLQIVMDSCEGSRLFYMITSDMAKSELIIKVGSTLTVSELPPEIYKQLMDSEKEIRAREDGTPETKEVIVRTDSVFLDKDKKPLRHMSHTEKIQQLHDKELEKESG